MVLLYCHKREAGHSVQGQAATWTLAFRDNSQFVVGSMGHPGAICEVGLAHGTVRILLHVMLLTATLSLIAPAALFACSTLKICGFILPSCVCLDCAVLLS